MPDPRPAVTFGRYTRPLQFFERGGTESAPMSTTSDRRVAEEYATRPDAAGNAPATSVLFKIVVDGAIETPFVRGLMGDEAFAAAKAAGGLLAPEAIADTYFHLHQQPRPAWTHELDLRPAAEAPWWSPRAKV